MMSVTFKYVTIMMRADNQGEGGILALFALAQRHPEAGRHWFTLAHRTGAGGHGVLLLRCTDHAGHLGVECGRGPGAAGSRLREGVIPVTLAVLALLFFIQKRGTARVAGCSGRS